MIHLYNYIKITYAKAKSFFIFAFSICQQSYLTNSLYPQVTKKHNHSLSTQLIFQIRKNLLWYTLNKRRCIMNKIYLCIDLKVILCLGRVRRAGP